MASKLYLKPEVVYKISRWFLKFKEVLSEECMSHGLYRGEFYSDLNEFICLDMLCSTYEGNFSREEITFDSENDVLYLSVKLSIKDQQRVCDSIRELMENIVGLGQPISHIYFDFTSSFVKGILEKDYNEEGSVILYMIGKVNSYSEGVCIGEASKIVGKRLAGNWERG